MIICEKNEKADWIISRMLNEEFLKLNPIVAGGAALHIYRSILYHDTEYKWSLFTKSMEKANRDTPRQAFSSIAGNFSDIDIWFMDNNLIFDKDNKFNYLVTDNWAASNAKLPSIDKSCVMKPPHTNPINVKSLQKFSEWCNTFDRKKEWNNSKLYHQFNHPLQVITKGINSIADLLNDFDFVNCSVAWHNGLFYYNSNLDKAFENFELRMNKGKDYSNKDIVFRIYHANRSFKYAERFSLEFDDLLAQQVLSAFVESNDIDYSEFKHSFSVNLETLYGVETMNKAALKGMIDTLYNNFNIFYKMKSFKEDWLVYMINLHERIPAIRRLIEGHGVSCPSRQESGHSPIWATIWTTP